MLAAFDVHFLPCRLVKAIMKFCTFKMFLFSTAIRQVLFHKTVEQLTYAAKCFIISVKFMPFTITGEIHPPSVCLCAFDFIGCVF